MPSLMAPMKTLQHRANVNGTRDKPSLQSILLVQIEHHRTGAFYNLDPVRYPRAFVRKLPRYVKKPLC